MMKTAARRSEQKRAKRRKKTWSFRSLHAPPHVKKKLISPRAANKQENRSPHVSSQSRPPLLPQAPVSSARERCIKWILAMPDQSKWSKGVTMSTASGKAPGSEADDDDSADVAAKTNALANETAPRTALTSDGAKQPPPFGPCCSTTSKKQNAQQKCTKKWAECPFPCSSASRNCYRGPPGEDPCVRKRKSVDELPCMKKIKQRWKSRLKPTRRKTKFVYQKKHRSGHFLSERRGECTG